MALNSFPWCWAGIKVINGIRVDRRADAHTTRPAVAKSKGKTNKLQDAKVAA